MEKFKRKVSLYLAFIMLVGLLSPLSGPMKSVFASVPMNFRIDQTRFLTVDPVTGLTVLQTVTGPAATRPQDQSAHITWTVPQAGFTDEFHVLRFFNTLGYRMELTVAPIIQAPGPGVTPMLRVTFDIYERMPRTGALLGYRNIQDPLRFAATPPAPAVSFGIFDTFTHANPGQPRPVLDFITANVDDIQNNFGRRTDAAGERRVNSRPRFTYYDGTDLSVDGGFPLAFDVTETAAGFPNNLNMDEIPGGLTAQEGIDLIARLTPSFDINSGQGFSFFYYNMMVHFFWEGNNFHVFFDGTQMDGRYQLEFARLYEFHIESFPLDQQVNYFANNVSNHPASAPPSAFPNPILEGSSMFFTGFGTGVNLDENFHILPFAANVDAPPGTPPGVFPRIPSTFPVIGVQPPIRTLSDSGSPLNTDPIRINDRDGRNRFFALPATHPFFPDADPPDHQPYVRPASHDVGFEVRIAIPRLFEEATGGFTHTLYDRNLSLNANFNMTRVAGAFNNRFDVLMAGIDLSGNPVPANPSITNNYWNPAARPVVSQIGFLDGEEFIYVRVQHLDANLCYTSAVINLSIPDGHFLLQPNLPTPNFQTILPINQQSPFFTFLRYDIIDVGDVWPHIEIHPFLLPGTEVPRPGYYRILAEQGGVLTDITGPFRIDHAPYVIDIPASHPDLIVPPDGVNRFQVVFMPIPGVEVLSQVVEYIRALRPFTVSNPNPFIISDVVMLPTRAEPGAPSPIDYRRGEVSFRARWNVAHINDINGMLATTDTGIIGIDYMFNIQYIPNLDLPQNPMEYFPIRIEIISRDVIETHFPPAEFPQLYIAGNLDPRISFVMRYVIDDQPNAPLYILPHLNQFHDDGWFFLHNVTNLQADIRLVTHALHYNHALAITYKLNFPALYFLHVQALGWEEYGFVGGELFPTNNPDVGHFIGDNPVWRSVEQPLTLSEMIEEFPPPPRDLTVRRAEILPPGEEYELGPALTVDFTIPINELSTFATNVPDLLPYVSANIYISGSESRASEFAMAERFNPLTMDHIPTFPFPEELLENGWDGIIDLTDFGGVNIRDLLRQPGSLVRIENVPVLPFFPTNLNFVPLEEGSSAPLEVISGAAIAATYTRLTQQLHLPINVSIIFDELDENQQYFFFADIGVAMYEPYTENGVVVEHHLVRHSFSTFSNIGGGTTRGYVELPEPGDFVPGQPTNFVAENITSTSVDLFWNPPFGLPPGSPPEVIVRYEIMRILDGPSLTAEEARMSELSLFDSLNLFDAVGWQMGGDLIDDLPFGVQRPTGPNTFVRESDVHFLYNHSQDPSIRAHFRDNTLRPNQVYFYYVRTVVITTTYPGGVEIIHRSSWVERPVTTLPVEAPFNLRVIDGNVLPDFDPLTQIYVAWDIHMAGGILGTEAERIDFLVTEMMGDLFTFEFQLRREEDPWEEVQQFGLDQLRDRTRISVNFDGSFTFRYLLSGLDHSTLYNMHVRLVDLTNDDRSMWSNVIFFLTEFYLPDLEREREIDNWLNAARSRADAILRRPYWIAQATNTIIVYRPAPIFTQLIQGTPGTSIPLHNNDANNITYYMPIGNITAANEARKGFSTTFSDIEVVMPPSFLNPARNDVLIDMARLRNARGSDYSDMFVRIDTELRPFANIEGAPSAARQIAIDATAVNTNRNFATIAAWDTHVYNQARGIITDRLADDFIIRESIRDLLDTYHTNEEILFYVFRIVEIIEHDISRMVLRYLYGDDSILSETSMSFTNFDVNILVTLLGTRQDESVNAFRLFTADWIFENTTRMANGFTVSTRTPGTFAFTARLIIIDDVEEMPRGRAVIEIVAFFGLEDFFGEYVNIHQNASRGMVVGSIARIAGAPRAADPIAWSAANMNMQFTSRNAAALIPYQEAVAALMALYERRTNTRLASIVIRNTQITAGMNLDPRFSHAVNAAFEVGIIANRDIDPRGAITIGEFLDMLTEFRRRANL